MMREFPGLTAITVWDLALFEWWGVATFVDELAQARAEQARKHGKRR